VRHRRHEREVNDFACGIKPRRGPLANLPGADVWRHARGDGAHCPCAARHAANDNIFSDDCSRSGPAVSEERPSALSVLGYLVHFDPKSTQNFKWP
jgi:hypothetical protein